MNPVFNHVNFLPPARVGQQQTAADRRWACSGLQDGDFYISPAFLDKMTVHIAKNYLTLPKIKVRA
jgi:hypothetical protein